jgi:Mce-associated membrane protein
LSEYDGPRHEPAPDQPWMSPVLSWVVTGVIAVVALAALAVVVVQLFVLRPAVAEIETDTRARGEVVRSAERFTVEVNNYDASDVSTLKERIAPLLTTKFRTDFEKSMDDIVVQIEQAKLTSTGEVLKSAVASMDADSAEVLVVADADTQSVFDRRARHFRWSIDLVKVDGEWLVDNFTPVA